MRKILWVSILSIVGLMLLRLLSTFVYTSPGQKAQCIMVAHNGKAIFLSLFDRAVTRSWPPEPDVWPKDGQYRSSTDFFKALVSNEWIKGVDYSFFSAPGLKTQSDPRDPTQFSSENNAWSIVTLLDSKTLELTDRSHVPFLFTKNIGFGDPPRPPWPGATLADMTGLIKKQQPFGDTYGVIVTYGGAVRIFANRDATQANLNRKGYAFKVLPP